ncbi:MAG: redoxin domain-containing protein [Polyangiaceae bacterium]|nr:redoxin domain-containing protein [Polyangiaceae bacterium]
MAFTKLVRRSVSLRRSLLGVGVLAVASLLLANGCEPELDGTTCGDGLVGAVEQCDGSDFGGATCASHGFDEGSLGCFNSCTVDTSGCFLLDADADGADIHEEQAAGTDPENPDSDGDGFLDGEELDAAASPLDIASWPYDSGRWPNRLPAAVADGVPPGAWSVFGAPPVGALMPDYLVTDQHGAPLQLHQFYGYKIMLSIGAVWCGPCNLAAESSPALWESHKTEGVIFLEILVESTSVGQPSKQSDATNWANHYGLAYPVGWGPDHLHPSSIPTYYFLHSDLTIAEVQEGYGDDASLATALAKLH